MKVDRRKFIHLGAWSGAALALPNPLKLAQKERKPWNEQPAKITRKHRNPRPTTCSLCDNHCGITSYREGDRVVMLLGNQEHPIAGGKLCAKAYGQLDRLYDFDRVLKPRKRVGERGEGKWLDISWDEAYKILQEKLTPAVNGEGPALTFINGRDELLTDAFLSLFPRVSRVAADDSISAARFRQEIFGRSECFRHYSQCRYVLNFAADPFRRGEAYITDAQSLIAGINENALELVTIAGRLSQTGGKSAAWHPVHPRHYGDVAKAIAAVMLAHGWHDKSALAQSGLNAADLKAYLRAFTPAVISRQTGLSEKVFTEIAKKLSQRTPSLVILGDEVFRTDNGWENACAIELLNVLCGALAPKGALKFDDAYAFSGGNPSGSGNSIKSASWFLHDLKQNSRAQILISYQANPVFDNYNGRWWPQTLLKNRALVPFYAAFDTYINETSQFADLILPMATELECWGLFSRRVNHRERCLSLRQPVSRPTDEILLLRKAKIKNLELFNPALAPVASSREFNQVVLDLGKKLLGESVSGPLRHADVESYIKEILADIPGMENAGGLAYLKKTGFFLYPDAAQKPRSVALSIKKLGRSQPVAQEKYSADELYLIPFTWNVLDSQTANSKYLAELRHKNPLWINADRAHKLGLKDGDKVKLRTEKGELSVKVWTTQAIHPDCVAMAVGHGHSKIGRVAQAKNIADYDPMTKSLLSRKNFFFTPYTFRLSSWDKKEPIWWHKDGNGTHFNSLLSGVPDTHAPGLTYINPLVKIIKS